MTVALRSHPRTVTAPVGVLPPWRVDVREVLLEVSDVVVTGSGVEDDVDEGRNEEDRYAVGNASTGVALFSRPTSREDVSPRPGGASVCHSRSQKTRHTSSMSRTLALPPTT
jgi:hypothetical protein